MSGSDSAESGTWERFRGLFPVTQRWAYFDNAAVSPLPAPTRAAVAQWADEATLEGVTVWSNWVRRVERLRETAAALMGADVDEIALVSNTTSGISLIAEGWPWQSGDNVVTLANEFPSNLYPWLNLASRGVEARLVPVEGVAVDLDRLLEACDERTRLVAVSWIGYATGFRLDVAELVRSAHARGIAVLLDAIQGLGVFPLDVHEAEVDFVAADGHKWMLGPEGAGLLYLRREHLDRLRPLGVGWNSVVQRYDYSRVELNLRPCAARYEGGSQNIVGLLGLGASLDLLVAYGLTARHSPLADRVLELTESACERLSQLGASIISDRRGPHRSGIVAFDLPGRNAAEVRRRCFEQQVALSCRSGWLRISPHAYANEADLERLVACLQ